MDDRNWSAAAYSSGERHLPHVQQFVPLKLNDYRFCSEPGQVDVDANKGHRSEDRGKVEWRDPAILFPPSLTPAPVLSNPSPPANHLI